MKPSLLRMCVYCCRDEVVEKTNEYLTTGIAFKCIVPNHKMQLTSFTLSIKRARGKIDLLLSATGR